MALLLGVPLGAALQLHQSALWPLSWYAAAALVALAMGLLARRVALPLPAVVLWVAVSGMVTFSLTGARAVQFHSQALSATLEGRDLVVEGWVAGLPRQGDSGVQFEWVTDQAWLEGDPVHVPRRVWLSWRASPWPGSGEAASAASGAVTDVRAGERWRMTVRFYRPHGLSNPGGFDTELWFWEQRLQATGTVRRGAQVEPPTRLEPTWRYPVSQLRQATRDRLLAQVGESTGAGMLLALLTGDQSVVTADQWAVYRITGVTHLVVVSGMHITLFAWLAMAVVGAVWRLVGRTRPGLLLRWPTPWVAAWGGVVLAGAYAVFSGLGVPAQRAILMLLTLVALRFSGRRWPWPVVWLAVMAVVVLIDPWALLRPGFWLSFFAVAVLFATSQPWLGPERGWRRQLADLIRTQALVTVALAPLTLLWFGEFSLVGLLANLLAIPWVTLVVTPLSLGGALWPWWWSLGTWTVDVLSVWLEWLAIWPLASIQRPATPWVLSVLAVAGGVVLVAPWPKALRVWGLLLIWPVLWYAPPRPAHGQFEWMAPDVGQGTAVVIRTARHTLIYDTGPPMGTQVVAAERVLLPVLRRLGDTAHTIVISHGDSDHASGMAVLQSAFPSAQWWGSFEPEPSWRGHWNRCVAGQRWEWDGVAFEFLHPWPQDVGSRMSDNAMSCVLRIATASHALLLTGDITMAEETRLALSQPDLRANVLFAGHHGSKTSTGPVWLNTVRPQVVVIQAGHRNRFGHPSEDVIRRLDERGIAWYSTPQCGAVSGRSAAPTQIDCHRQTHRRYWHHQPP